MVFTKEFVTQLSWMASLTSRQKSDNQKYRLKSSRWIYLLLLLNFEELFPSSDNVNAFKIIHYLPAFRIPFALLYFYCVRSLSYAHPTRKGTTTATAAQNVSTVLHEYFNEILVIGFRKMKQQFTLRARVWLCVYVYWCSCLASTRLWLTDTLTLWNAIMAHKCVHLQTF